MASANASAVSVPMWGGEWVRYCMGEVRPSRNPALDHTIDASDTRSLIAFPAAVGAAFDMAGAATVACASKSFYLGRG